MWYFIMNDLGKMIFQNNDHIYQITSFPCGDSLTTEEVLATRKTISRPAQTVTENLTLI